MRKQSDLSDVQKGMITCFWIKGGSISETANSMKCLRTAMVHMYGDWQYGTNQNVACMLHHGPQMSEVNDVCGTASR